MPLFHRHRWVAIRALRGEYALGRGRGTEILQRCTACAATSTRTINGWWTLEELTGEPA